MKVLYYNIVKFHVSKVKRYWLILVVNNDVVNEMDLIGKEYVCNN